MRFEEAYTGWQAGRLTQAETARLPGVCERTLRRQINRYEADGMEGLLDKRLAKFSHQRAPVDEVMALIDLYRTDYQGWNTKHFHTWYARDHGGQRSYTCVKNQLQQAGSVVRAKARSKHREQREREPLPGMMVHQDASDHEWIPGHRWDMAVTMGDATNAQLSVFFCDEEGTGSSFHGIGQTIACHGLFSVFYTDRGSRYFTYAGGGGDQHGGGQPIFGTSIHAPTRCRVRGAGSSGRRGVYPLFGNRLPDVLCEQHERTVGDDNCVGFKGLKLQVPADDAQHHYVKVVVRVREWNIGDISRAAQIDGL